MIGFIKRNGKKICKYTLNTLNFINAILLVLIPIWNIPYENEIQATIIGITGVLSTYLLGSKAKSKNIEFEEIK